MFIVAHGALSILEINPRNRYERVDAFTTVQHTDPT